MLRWFPRGDVMHATMKFVVMALLLGCASGCSDSDGAGGGCDGSKRGCVQLLNYTFSEQTVTITSGAGGSAVVPAATGVNPGIAWITVDSTVGAQVDFSVSILTPGTAWCLVSSTTWTDPAKPPEVTFRTVTYGSGTGLDCINWCNKVTTLCF